MPASVHSVVPDSILPKGWSWSSLVAETAGLGPVQGIEVCVRSTAPMPHGWRLIVQEFSREEFAMTRPVASAQRNVTPAELSAGVTLRLYRDKGAARDDSYVVAWVEPGGATLEFDGLEAAPSAEAWVGQASVHGRRTTVTVVPAEPAHDDVLNAA